MHLFLESRKILCQILGTVCKEVLRLSHATVSYFSECSQSAVLKSVEKDLVASKRYAHAAASLGNGKQVMHVLSFYGVSGANSCSQEMARNEVLLAKVF